MHSNVMVVIHFLVVVYDNVGELSYAISSWSASTRYLASMLTKGTKVDSSTLNTLDQHLCQIYDTVLLDHDSVNNLKNVAMCQYH